MLLYENMVLNSLAVATISLTPDVGQSIRVKDICVLPTVGMTELMTIQVSRQTVGYIHCGTLGFNQLPYQSEDEPQITIMQQLKNAGYDLSYPVAEGETITFTLPTAWTYLQITYDIYSAGDVKATEPNGSQSNEYTFLQYGTYDTAITATGTYTLNKCHNPVEFPNFPFGDPVPSKRTMEILGIGCPAYLRSGAAFATDWLNTTYLTLYREREVLFDDDRNGFLIMADTALSLANNTDYFSPQDSVLPYGGAGMYKPIFLFPNPLIFEAGEELAVQIPFGVPAGVTTLAADAMYVCMPIRVKSAS